MTLGYKWLLLILLLSYGTNAAADQIAEQHRSDWYYGLGLGRATVLNAYYKYEGETTKFEDWADSQNYNQALYNLKWGKTINDYLLVGLDFSIVNYANGALIADNVNLKFINITNYFAVATYFPWMKGWLFRAGAGYSRLVRQQDFKDAVEKNTYEHTSGYGFVAGVGYSFPLGKSFNLSVYVDHSKQWYKQSSSEPDRTGFSVLYMGFDWY